MSCCMLLRKSLIIWFFLQIVALPELEKMRLLANFQTECAHHINGQFSKYSKNKSFVHLEIIKTMFRSECEKSRNDQNMHKINLLVQYLVDFARMDAFVNSNLELVLMSTISMKVNSNFYYLAANSIREKVHIFIHLIFFILY